MNVPGASADELRDAFAAAGQGHVFRWWDEIGPQGRAKLLAQLRSVDPGQLASLAADVNAGRLTPETPGEPKNQV